MRCGSIPSMIARFEDGSIVFSLCLLSRGFVLFHIGRGKGPGPSVCRYSCCEQHTNTVCSQRRSVLSVIHASSAAHTLSAGGLRGSKYSVSSTAASSHSSSLPLCAHARHRAVQRMWCPTAASGFAPSSVLPLSQRRLSPCGCLLAPSPPIIASAVACCKWVMITSRGHHHRARLRGRGRGPSHASPSRLCARCTGASRPRCPSP